MDVSNEEIPVIIGKGSNVLRRLIPTMDLNSAVAIPLSLDQTISGEIHIQAIITEIESSLGEFS